MSDISLYYTVTIDLGFNKTYIILFKHKILLYKTITVTSQVPLTSRQYKLMCNRGKICPTSV